MTLCIVTKQQCVCQPDEACWCPHYKPDWYAQCLMDAIIELRAEAETIRNVLRDFAIVKDERCAYCQQCHTGWFGDTSVEKHAEGCIAAIQK